MTYKPMPKQKFLEYLKRAGWTLERGSIDWNVYSESDMFVCSVIISHGINTKANEITAKSVHKVKKKV